MTNRLEGSAACARALVAVALLALVGCGGDDPSSARDAGDDAAAELPIDASMTMMIDASVLDAKLCDHAMCGVDCVDLTSSSLHCGACGVACPAGTACSAGVCALVCSAGRSLCVPGDGGSAACVDENTDRFHCGACGAACPAGNICVNGSCEVSCPGGAVECDGHCVDPRSARQYCGATAGCGVDGIGSAGTACPSGTVCGNAACQLSCPGAQIPCAGMCVDPSTDLAHCGASADCTGTHQGASCASGSVCTGGLCALSCAGTQVACNGMCIDPLTDRGYCGASANCQGPNDGAVCETGEVCAAGRCAISCPPSQLDCSGTCVDPLRDRGFCGASADCQGEHAGTACGPGEVCNEGDCAVSCPETQTNCGGVCIDPLTNRGFCGASGDCLGDDAGTQCAPGEVCSGGACAVSCQAGFVNCDGTCINPLVNRDHCGAYADCQGQSAGAACLAGQVCSEGACVLSCQAGLIDCGGTCVDPLTDLTHCGATDTCQGADAGSACAPGQVCSLGRCDLSCQAGLVSCGGLCINPAINRTYCGASSDCEGEQDGFACLPGEVCSGGTCRLSCQAGLIDCDGTCVSPFTERNYCGAVDNCQGLNAGVRCMAGEVCGAGTCTVSCPGTQIDCHGTCIEPQTDRVYCGATGDCEGESAGTPCVAGEVCSGGRCVTSCASTQVDCDGVCIDPRSDRAHCGASADCLGENAGVVCSNGQLCGNGTCTISCPGSQIECSGTCIEPTTDRGYCGASGDCEDPSDGTVCLPGEACSNGTCSTSCPGSQLNCNDLCVRPESNRDYCGASGDCEGANDGEACAPGEACSSGLCVVSCPGATLNCNGVCVDPLTSRTHCGAGGDCQGASAGTACAAGEVCGGGQCVISCPGTQIECDGTCIDPLTDRSHCGSSGSCQGTSDGTACLAGQVCSAGTCSLTCGASQVNCGGTCIDPQTDRGYCGASDNCQGANDGDVCDPGEVCAAGVCAVSCPGAQIVCNGRCVDPQTDPAYCGASGDCQGANDGSVCQAGEVCAAAACTVSCANTQVNCGGTCIDPQSDRTHCGATGDCLSTRSGAVCASGELCSAGTCALSCPSSQVRCNGRCIDPTTDSGYCGASGTCQGASAGAACPGGQVCIASQCTVSCLSGRINCSGSCIDPSTNPTYCGASGSCSGVTDGTVCTPFQACVSGTCVAIERRLVFITDSVYTGAEIGGLNGADMKCQATATAANLLGSYRAWLSDSSTSASSRMTHSPYRYMRVDGVKVADNWTDLTDGTLDARILLTATGGVPSGATACGAWTNTTAAGANYADANACQDWTSTTGNALAADATSVAGDWTQGCTADCSLLAPLICVEQ